MTNSPNILVVDDEEGIRVILEIGFQEIGANTILASNGKKALDILKNQKVDLLLSDIQMPELDGIELLKELKRIKHQKLVIILISGNSEITEESMKPLGVAKVFRKPFILDSFVKEVMTVYENEVKKVT